MRPVLLRAALWCMMVATAASEAEAVVMFGPIPPGPVVAQPGWPGWAEAWLDSRPSLGGTMFDGWGTNRREFFYAGDPAAFVAFLEAADAARASQGPLAYPPVTVSLAVLPGRGRVTGADVERYGLPGPIAYDWQVNISTNYHDHLPKTPYVVTLTDARGREVPRTVPLSPLLQQGTTIQVVWYAGDGTALDGLDLPLGWLNRDPSRAEIVQLVASSPIIADDAEAQAEDRVAALRVVHFMTRQRNRAETAATAWRIGAFYGLTVDLAYEADAPPRVRVTYGDRVADYDLTTGTPVTVQPDFPPGTLPPTADRLVRRWLRERRDAVLEQWRRAKAGEAIEMVPALE